MTHEALIPIRLDRQRLSYCLSLLSLASERGTCVCVYVSSYHREVCKLEKPGKCQQNLIVYLSLPSRSSHVRGEKRSKFTFSRNSKR